MGLLTTIDEIPLYSTVQEAIEWADRNGLNGAHIHKWKGRLGYMGGANHAEAEAVSGGEGSPHPCKDPLWISLLPGTPSNLQKIDYCNRCAAQSGTNPQLGNFPVSIVNGYWNHHQGGINYCPCCSPTIGAIPVDVPLVDEIGDAPPTTPTTQPPPTTGGDGGY